MQADRIALVEVQPGRVAPFLGDRQHVGEVVKADDAGEFDAIVTHREIVDPVRALGRGSEDEDVGPSASHQEVVASTADERVRTFLTKQGVVTIVTAGHVIAAVSIDFIVVRRLDEPMDDIVGGRGVLVEVDRADVGVRPSRSASELHLLDNRP